MKKILFLTGTRADFGKLKSLIKISQESNLYDVHIFATGMHMNSKYGKTVDEIYKAGFTNIYQFINHDTVEHMDRTLAKTIQGFSDYVEDIQPDLIVVHGDRVEALAGSIVGSLNNILVAHVEGGEISGTIDELIRHAVSKMSHLHFVANNEAKKRLLQLGEREKSIFIIGSPDLDLMNPKSLPTIEKVKTYYNINFSEFAIAMFHPVTTEYKAIQQNVKEFLNALIASKKNYILVYPNNDLGSIEILNEYKRVESNPNFKIYPSLRFEYFLALLQDASFIVGNSSAGVREAPFYNTPTINIGSRQLNRTSLSTILDCKNTSEEILNAINTYKKSNTPPIKKAFGEGKSDRLFLELLNSNKLWKTQQQKQFVELK